MATEKWNRVILREICDSVNYGYTASAEPEPIGPKFLRITDIMPDQIDWASVPYCKINKKALSKYRLEKGDIVIARTGTPGYAKCIKTDHHAVFASYLVRIRVNPKHDSRYVGFVIESDEYKQFVKQNASGTAQSHANAQVLTSFPIPLPPLPTQQKIAAILNPYDELIENNIRRIKILEEMAQAIYREWFVEFRFPGREKVKMVESELGSIPQGWEVGGLGDLCSVVPGYAFKSKDWQDTGVAVVKIKNIKSDNTIDTQDMDCVSSEILSSKLDRYRLINGDFLIAMTGATAGKVGRLRTKTTMMLNQRVAKLDPIDVYRDYVWCKISIEETQKAFFRLADGAAQPNMSGSQIENYRIVCPPPSVCKDFSSVVGEMLIQTDNLMLCNTNLRQTRDLLLPKLISGEIDVSKLDIDTDGIQPRKGGTYIPYPLTHWLRSDEKILGGEPVIKGTRLAVASILELLARGWSEKEVLENYPSIGSEHIDACLAYQQKVTDASVS